MSEFTGESDPLGVNTPLLDTITAAWPSEGRNERSGAPILNATVPNETAVRFLGLAESGAARIDKVKCTDYEVGPGFRRHTTLVIGRVSHTQEDQAGEFDGYFIGEELNGYGQYLLLSPQNVLVMELGLSAAERMTLFLLQRD